MSADDMMARLMAMAGDDTAVADKPEPKPKAKPEQAAARAARPAPQAAEVVADPAPVQAGPLMPVVVLDDGATFSDLTGCKVCFVPPDAEQITAEDLFSETSVDISELLTLRDAIETILKIVRR